VSASASASAVILLDTDAFSAVFRDPADHPYRSVTDGRRLIITLFTCAETLAGAAQANWGPARVARLEAALARLGIVQITMRIVRTYADVTATATRIGHPLAGPTQVTDRWIAATAIHHNLPLLTGNTRHFDDFPGLTLVTTT
jgi:tRNA(fMet)-specific endonuclease VapC